MTADTRSNTLGFLIMGTGNDNNTWGVNANSAVFQILEDAIANALTGTITGGTLDLSTPSPPSGPSLVRFAALLFNGVLSSNQIIVVPNIQKIWLVQNSTSNATTPMTLTFQTPLGTASTPIPQNSGFQTVYCDGNNNIIVFPFNSQQLLMPDGSLASPAYSNVNETNSGWRRAGVQDFRLVYGGADVLQITGPGASSPNLFNMLGLTPQINGVGIQIPPGSEFDYAGILLPSGWLWEDGALYARAAYTPLFNAITATVTGDSSGVNISGMSADMRNLGLVGAFIEGTGVSVGTTITAIPSATTMTVSPGISGGTHLGDTFRIIPWGQGDGSTTFNVPDRRGRPVYGRSDMNGTNVARIPLVDATKLSSTRSGQTDSLQEYAIGTPFTALNPPIAISNKIIKT